MFSLFLKRARRPPVRPVGDDDYNALCIAHRIEVVRVRITEAGQQMPATE